MRNMRPSESWNRDSHDPCSESVLRQWWLQTRRMAINVRQILVALSEARIEMKRCAGRPRDIEDIDKLQQIQQAERWAP